MRLTGIYFHLQSVWDRNQSNVYNSWVGFFSFFFLKKWQLLLIKRLTWNTVAFGENFRITNNFQDCLLIQGWWTQGNTWETAIFQSTSSFTDVIIQHSFCFLSNTCSGFSSLTTCSWISSTYSFTTAMHHKNNYYEIQKLKKLPENKTSLNKSSNEARW